MSDIHNILNKFNQLGIKNKGLTVDAPVAPAKEQSTGSGTDVNANAHARNVNESVRGKHIPGVTDVSTNDMAALAGLGKSTSRPRPAQPTPSTMYAEPVQTIPSNTNPYAEIEARLDNIESKLNKIFEAVMYNEEKDSDKHKRHTKDLDDLEREIRKSGAMDKEMSNAIKLRRSKIIKDKLSAEDKAKPTSKSLFKEYLEFLEEKK
jgi:hypothetical protein